MASAAIRAREFGDWVYQNLKKAGQQAHRQGQRGGLLAKLPMPWGR